uniref:Exocyst subunit Exo70 family protein n=1 Tax=Arundo donax TaxID=35708 RepID=A0A0A9FK59_ARUDO
MMIPIPTMGGTVHASILKDNIVKDYRDERRGQAVQALNCYLEICTRAEVRAEILMIENDNVAAGLLELILDHKITTLIIIGIGKSWVNRSRRNLAAALQKGTDPSCHILFLQKGRLISIRQQNGSVFPFGTKETPSFVSSRRLSLTWSSSCASSTPSPFLWDSRSTPSSLFWDSRSTPDSLDLLQLDDPSLENAGSIFGDGSLSIILGHESINILRELTGHLNLAEYSHESCQTFQSKYSEISKISNRCQFIGGIDLVLGADSENFGEEYWKTIKGWPAAFEHIVRVIDTVQQLIKQNICECNGLTPDKLSIAAKELLSRLLNVALAVTEVRKSPEKLFCILYMCKALVDSAPSLRTVFSADFLSRVDRVLTVLNDSARGILREFKVLIQNYSSQKVVQDGSILLITGYVMKYIRLLTNHAVSLDTILGHGQNNDLLSVEGISTTGHLVCRLIGDLNDVIEEKSRLYASEGLRCIFLMNNAHFIMQEVEHSDIKLIVGAEWLSQRRHDFDRYMRGYMSVSWERVTHHLAIATSPHKRLKSNLRGLFNITARPLQCFDSSFHETCNSQMHWKVPCPVLRNKLRVNIWEHVIRAYRSYLETLKQSAVGTAEDLEWELQSKVNELFEG